MVHHDRSSRSDRGEESNRGARRRTVGRRSFLSAVGAGGLASIAGRASAASGSDSLVEVASFPDRLVTGVAVSGDGRVFVNFPRFPWAVPVDVSVAELAEDGSLVPYPSEGWNAGGWNSENKAWTGDDARREFVGVQSVHVEPEDPTTLWVLDTGNPMFEAIVEGGPKLVRVDLDRDEVADVHHFSADVTPVPSSPAYLNDVRVDVDRGVAYLTDSELGALVVVDLDTGEEQRIMDDWSAFPSTHNRPNGHYNIGPHEDQTRPMPGPTDFHSDGIAITPDNESIYYHALSGRDLYRLDAAVLRDFSLSETEIGEQVEHVGETDITDGMLTDEAGNVYHTDVEDDAVTRWNAESRRMETVVRDSDRIKWPDSMAWGPDGDLYVTTSKLHLEMTETRTDPFKLFRIPDVGP